MSQLDLEKNVAADNERLRTASREAQYEWLIEKLYEAFAQARKGKLDTVNEQRFEENRDVELVRLADDILHETYVPSRSVAFIVTEPTPREIFAASFRDRVVHHFLVQQNGHFWDKRLSPRSFSCREGKGALYGIRHLRRDMQRATNDWKDEAWVMKIDIQGYFMSLECKKLYSRAMWGLSRQFPEEGYVYQICKFLWRIITFNDPLKDVLFSCPRSAWKGLPPSKILFRQPEGRGIAICTGVYWIILSGTKAFGQSLG